MSIKPAMTPKAMNDLRNKKLGPARRAEIARAAAKARWKKKKG